MKTSSTWARDYSWIEHFLGGSGLLAGAGGWICLLTGEPLTAIALWVWLLFTDQALRQIP